MKVYVHSKDDCPHCTSAKEYLNENEIIFEEILHNDVTERNAFYDSIGLINDLRFVPQIIVVESNCQKTRYGGNVALRNSDLVDRIYAGVVTDDF